MLLGYIVFLILLDSTTILINWEYVDENNFDLHDITSVGGKFRYFLVGFIFPQTLKTYGYKGKIFIEPYNKINLTKLSGANEIHSNWDNLSVITKP